MPPSQSKQTETLKKLYVTLKTTQARLAQLERAHNAPIAIIGMGCRFPGGASTPEKLWSLLEQGNDGTCEVPADRWNARDYYDPNPEAPGKMYTMRGGFLVEDVYGFDAGFFGLTPKETLGMDPQHRLLLEVSWEALENAHLDVPSLKGTKTGVFVGISSFDYATAHVHSGDLTKLDAYSVTGIALSTAPGRISYLLGLEGPSLAVDTACSSSLVSLHLACQSLRSGESSLALAGGVNLMLTPEINVGFSRLKGLSPAGCCKVFDASADGYARGEGCGLLVLKTYSQALKDGDAILAVVIGSAVNQDGRSNGFTAPNGRAQQNVIRDALRGAGLTPSAVDYVEAHGTGTPLGDPIEIEALASVYGRDRSMQSPLRVGSIKANIGHLEAAAGSAGLIKTVLQLQHQAFCPQIHFHQPNPHIPWSESPIQIPLRLTDWPASAAGRVAGVSAFGFSGTNAHILLREAPSQPASDVPAPDRPVHLLNLSARNQDVLTVMTSQYADFLGQKSGGEDPRVGDVCFSAVTTRARFPHRLAILGKTKAELGEKLRRWREGKEVGGVWQGAVGKEQGQRIAFLFTGQGAQYKQMGRELWETQPVFKACLQRCDEILKSLGDIRLLDLVFGDQLPEERLHQTIHTQPAIFSFGYSLAKMWESWGIEPKAVLGHSIGEMTAACFAGVFELEEALGLVALRGRLIQYSSAPGAMGAIVASAEAVAGAIERFGGQVSIAAINAPENTVISGAAAAVQRILDFFRSQNIPSQTLRISHAIHSPLMEPILDEFEAAAAQLHYSTPRIPVISNLTGRPGGEEMLRPNYWRRLMRETVNFRAGIESLHQSGCDICLETGTTSTLTSLGLQCLPNANMLWLSSLGASNSLFNMRPHRIPGGSDWETLLESLGQLFARGVELNWAEIERGFAWKKIHLPNYPFQRKPFRMETLRPKPAPIESDRSLQASSFPEVENRLNDAKTGLRESPVGDTISAEEIPFKLKQMLHRISGLDMASMELHAKLLELGVDSLMVSRFREVIRKEFHVPIEISWFFNKTDTLAKITDYILAHIPPPEKLKGPFPPTPETGHRSSLDERSHRIPPLPDGASEWERLIAGQIETMSDLMASQLEVLGKAKLPSATSLSNGRAATAGGTEPSRRKLLNVRSVKYDEDALTEQQKAYVKELIYRYNQRTAQSKAYAEKNRSFFADWINTLGFRQTLKELRYPIVSARSEGSRIWDIDGNEYIDLAMGYGVSFFGHRFPPVVQAVKEQLDRGYDLGPQSATAAEVAALVCELTGVERVAFSNTGSEAVMIALRLARTVTGKSKVVLFSGSYHGISDGVLAVPTEDSGVMPSAPGLPQSMVDNVILMDYGTLDTLEAIRTHAHELAAVLVEPVQSRRPGFHPKAFLQKLRQLTEETGVALIFDELITGFRVHPGGAQAWFEVKADLVTYGKIVGGGMPIGMVAGKARFMDAVDGGVWRFGDSSHPEKEMTFFAGTFCKHPLAMAAAKAVLTYIRDEGGRFYEELNRRADRLAARLNEFFRQGNIAIKMEHFGPLFRFESFGKYHLLRQPIEMDLLFYQLMEKGVYTWERRICCLSTAHTDDDIEQLILKVKESIEIMRTGGFPMENTRLAAESEGNARSEVLPVICPASSPQKRIYVLDQLEASQSSYQMSACQMIEGTPERAALNRALTTLLARHESLRTSFELQGELLVQRIEPKVDFKLEVIDGAGESLEDLFTRFGARFDLARAPLFRAWLIQRAPGKHLLAMTSHHIAIDGLSWNIFVQELLQLYQGQSLAQPRHQYRHFCDWLTGFYATDEFKRQEAYWLKTFEGDIPVLELPTDFPRPNQRTSAGDALHFTISKLATDALKAVGKKTGTTLYMVLLAAYNLLLHRLTQQWDLVVGCPTGGRPSEEYEGVVGMFANTLAIRLRAEPRMTVETFLASVKAKLVEIYEHQNYPFEQLIEKLRLKRDVSRNALIDTLLVFEWGDDRLIELPGLKLAPYPMRKTTSMFDLGLEIVEQRGELNVSMEFSTELFKRETMVRWADYFQRLLGGLADNLQTTLARLEILGADEIQRHLGSEHPGSTLRVDSQQTVMRLLDDQAQRQPAKTAVACGKDLLSYADLSHKSDQLARFMLGLGVTNHSRVGICCERSPEAIVAIFAILKTGAAYVPLDPSYPPDRFAFMLQDAEVGLVLTQRKLKGRFEPAGCRVVAVDEDGMSMAHGEAAVALPAVSHHHMAYCIYTSGSTGQPKAVLVNHGNLIYSTLARSAYYPGSVTALLLVSSFAFDTSVGGIFWTLSEGGTLVLPEEGWHADVIHLAELIDAHRVSHWLSVPSLYQLLLSESPTDRLASLNTVIVAGETCPKELVRQQQKLLPKVPLYNEYGPTEGTVWCAVDRVDRYDLDQITSVPIGRPIAGAHIYLLNECQQLAPIGVPGELCLEGRGVAQGYWHRPELTAARFIRNPFSQDPDSRLYRTGDWAVYREDGRLEFAGRADQQIKIRGYRVELEEIETVLKQCPQVRDGAIALRSRPGGGPALVAYVVARNSTESVDRTRGAVLDFLRAKLPDYMLPSSVAVLDQFPVTTHGKMDRRALPPPPLGQMTLADPEGKPRNDLERHLVEVWQSVLQLSPIGIHQNYLEMGGDSIKAIQIAARLRQRNLVLRIPDIFRFATIAQLASHLDPVTRAIEQTPFVGEVELTPIQRWLFEADLGHIDHFNQAVLLFASRSLDVGSLENAFQAVQIHHDLLRARFQRMNRGHHLMVTPSTLRVLRDTVDLRNESDPDDSLKRHAANLQACLNIENGPLMAAVVYRLATQERLLVVIHHLVMDFVSWRILIEDLTKAYLQCQAGQPVELPMKTDSFPRWSQHLHDALKSGFIQDQQAYWEAVLAPLSPPFALPVLDSNASANRVVDGVRLELVLDLVSTDALLQSNRAYNTETRDLLLAALVRVLAGWTGSAGCILELEHHGRTPLPGNELDLSRTIGWFTNIYPVRFESLTDWGRQIKTIKETLRHVPNSGVGYGVMRYLGTTTTQLRRTDSSRTSIAFNYLGDLSESEPNELFERIDEFHHQCHSPEAQRPHSLEIEAMIRRRQVNIAITFSQRQFHADAIQRLLEAYQNTLKELAHHCQGKEKTQLTPADLTYKGLSMDEMEGLLEDA